MTYRLNNPLHGAGVGPPQLNLNERESKMNMTYKMLRILSDVVKCNIGKHDGVYMTTKATYVTNTFFLAKFGDIVTPIDAVYRPNKDTKAIFTNVRKAKRLDLDLEIKQVKTTDGVEVYGLIYPTYLEGTEGFDAAYLDTSLYGTHVVGSMEKLISEATKNVSTNDKDKLKLFTSHVYNWGALQMLLDLYVQIYIGKEETANAAKFTYQLVPVGGANQLLITRGDFTALLAPIVI